MGKTKKYAVLTGDIIESSKLDVKQFAAARQALKETIKDFKELYPKAIVGDAAFFRGDGWQLLVAEPRYLLRLLLFISSGLKLRKVNNSRIGIAAGTVEEINSDNISLSIGRAFTESGRIMTDIENIKVKNDKPVWRLRDKNIHRAMLFEILASLANDWTDAVAQTIYVALQGKKPQEIAEKNGGSRQGIAKKMAGGKWNLIENILIIEEKRGRRCRN